MELQCMRYLKIEQLWLTSGTEVRNPICWASSSIFKMTFEAPPQSPKAPGVNMLVCTHV